METSTISRAYLTLQEASGIQKGDTVRVLRRANNGELGWDNVWVPEMDPAIGREYVVKRVNDSFGVNLVVNGNILAFPFFVLELVKKAPKPVMVRLSSGWNVVVTKDGINIDNTCSKLTLSDIKKLNSAAKKFD